MIKEVTADSTIEKSLDFDNLCTFVTNCKKCDRMCSSQRVLNRSAGNLNSDIMFIGEAPGRLGADDSGIPFHGDKAGHNFEELLEFAGINRSQIFVTNAILCNPKNDSGNNGTPTNTEILNCSEFLNQQIQLVNPKIIVTLGMTALKALSYIEEHHLTLNLHVRTCQKWCNRLLIPVYHPGQRAMLHRSFANQRSDYEFIANKLRSLDTKSKKVYGKTSSDVTNIVNTFFLFKNEYSYFSIHKLLYLIEYQFYKKQGIRLTSAYFVRQKDGPYCTNLHLFKLKKAIPELTSRTLNNVLFLYKKDQLGLFTFNQEFSSTLDDAVFDIINEVLEKYSGMTNTELKRAVYLTDPIKKMLRIEKEKRLNLYNAPIAF